MSKKESKQFIDELWRVKSIIAHIVVPDFSFDPEHEVTREWRYILNDLERDVGIIIDKAETEL